MAVTKQTHATVVGVFPTRGKAEQAMADLMQAGFRADQVGLIARDTSGKTVRTDGEGDNYAGEGAAIGAAAGAGVGGLVGLGVVSGVIPVIGPVLAIGTLGTILLNAAGGAAIASIAGALIGWGIPEEDASYYEGEVKAGRFLVTVQAGDRAAEARTILHRHGGYDRAAATTEAQSTSSATHSAASVGTGTERTVQLKEEQLRATKQPERVGEVGIRKEVHTEHQQINVPVEREEVVVERRPASGRAAGGDIKSEEIRIPVKEERVQVSKEQVGKEDVTIGKRKVQGTETVGGEVRKEDLIVDTEGKARVHQTGRADKP